MAARVITVTSESKEAGKTHFACGLARWLRNRGYHVAPIHLSTRNGDPVECPGGGRVTRAAALLAEACGLAPSPDFESGWQALDSLLQQHDVVVVEAPSAGPAPEGSIEVRVRRNGRSIDLPRGGSLPFFETDLMPAPDPELEALPAWRLGAGPRVGVISLPHITNFGEYQAFRGAEWLASPPVGRFGVVFIPGCSNEPSDVEWLQETGLLAWLSGQIQSGAVVAVSGWQEPDSLGVATRKLALGDLLDYRAVSRLLGMRMPVPLPSDELLERLGEWAGSWPGMEDLAKRLA